MSNTITLAEVIGMDITCEARANVEGLLQALICEGDLAHVDGEAIHLIVGATLAGAAKPIAERAWYQGWEAGTNDASTIHVGVVSANPYTPDDGE